MHQEHSLLVVGTSIDPHVSAVIDRLERSIDVYRFDVDRYPKSLRLTQWFNSGDTSIIIDDVNDKRVDIQSIGCVWFRRLGSPVSSRGVEEKYRDFVVSEAEHALMGMLSTLSSSLFINEIWATRRACYKPIQYALARRHGLIVPECIITNSVDEAYRWASRQKRIIAKTLSSPIIVKNDDGREYAFTNEVFKKTKCSLRQIKVTATQLQQAIEPAFELRVTSIRNHHYAVKIDTVEVDGSVRDWRSDRIDTSYSWYTLPDEVSLNLSRFHSELGIDFAASDFIVDKAGNHYFLESNPHGAWLWLEDSLGSTRISQAIADYISEQCLSV
jgi:hypothetical protein